MSSLIELRNLWLPFRSLQSRLLALALGLVVIPGLTFAVLTFSSARAGLERAIGRQLADKARETSELLIADLESVELALRAVIGQDLMRELVIGDIDKRVSGALLATKQASPAYLDLLCTNVAGDLVSSTNPNHFAGPLPLSAPALGKPNQLSVRGPVVLGTDGAEVLEIAAAVPDPDDPGRTLGTCLLLYDWQAADALADRMRKSLADGGERIEVFFVNEANEVIGGAWDTRKGTVGNRGSRFPVTATLGTRGFTHNPEIEALVGFATMNAGSNSWRVLTVQPDKEAFAPVAQMQRRWALTLAVIVLIAAVTTIVIARRLVRPLLALTEATRSVVRRGGLPAPVPVESTDEVGELAASFNTMTEKLERAQAELLNAAKFAFVGEVAAGIAHEVRTPLGVIKTSAQVLQKSVADSSERSRELTEMMIEEVNRLDRVVEGLLQLARPRQPNPETAELDKIAQRAVRFLEPQANTRQISLLFDMGGGDAVAWCDSDQIYQVLLNLTMNAIQILQPGGTVEIRLRGDDPSRVIVEVADDGPGIDAKTQEQIFTPFFTMREGGTGLGLALVDQIVRAHRGGVSVQSSLGHGTTFAFWLPRTPEE